MSTIEIIKCKICFEILKEPIRLPCDKYICKAHVNELEDKQTTCSLCDQIHTIPENGWLIDENFRIVTDCYRVVYTKISQDENYWELKKQIEEYERELEDYQVKAENPDLIIEERFASLMLQVDLRSEILKQQIDKISERLKDKINFEKERCIKIAKKNLPNEIDIKKEQSKIEKSKEDLELFMINSFQDNIDLIKDSRKKLRDEQENLQLQFLNNQEIKFVQSKEIINEKKFGRLEFNKKNKIERVKKLTGCQPSWIMSIALLPNGYLASGSLDSTIKILNLDDGCETHTLKGHRSAVVSLALFPNGELASGSSDKTIDIWNVGEERSKKTLTNHNGTVWSLAVLPNRDLASGSTDKTVIIWNVMEGTVKRTLELHSGTVFSLAVLPNGQLASGSEDKSIILWNVEEGTAIRKFTGHKGSVNSLVILPNGDLVSGSKDRSIKIWNIGKRKSKKTFACHGSVLSLAVLPNGDLASGLGDNTINIWNIGEEEAKITLHGLKSTGRSLLVFPNGDIASGYGDVIKIWNVEEQAHGKINK